MPSGTGLNQLKQALPTQYHDVGIAEEHAALFAAGIAARTTGPIVWCLTRPDLFFPVLAQVGQQWLAPG